MSRHCCALFLICFLLDLLYLVGELQWELDGLGLFLLLLLLLLFSSFNLTSPHRKDSDKSNSLIRWEIKMWDSDLSAKWPFQCDSKSQDIWLTSVFFSGEWCYCASSCQDSVCIQQCRMQCPDIIIRVLPYGTAFSCNAILGVWMYWYLWTFPLYLLTWYWLNRRWSIPASLSFMCCFTQGHYLSLIHIWRCRRR